VKDCGVSVVTGSFCLFLFDLKSQFPIYKRKLAKKNLSGEAINGSSHNLSLQIRILGEVKRKEPCLGKPAKF
jgi:hypothetical protein